MKTRLHSQIDDTSFLKNRRATQQEIMDDLNALTGSPPSAYKQKMTQVKSKGFRKIRRQKNKVMVDALLGVATLLSEKLSYNQQSFISGLLSNRATIHNTIAHFIKNFKPYDNDEA